MIQAWVNIYRKFLLVAALFSSSCIVQGETNHEILLREFQGIVDHSLRENRIVGASAALVLPGSGKVLSVASGWAHREDHRKMTPDSVLLAGSIGKTYAAVLAVSLAKNGVFDLDDPIMEWMENEPWFAALPNASTLTIRHLLTHSSGFPYHFELEKQVDYYKLLFENPGQVSTSPSSIISLISGEKAKFAAGSKHHYSDLNYLLLGVVIEAATGKDYYDLLRQKLLEPMALANTYPQTSPRIPRLAAGYLGDDFPFAIPSPTLHNDTLVYDPTFEWTGGGLATTATDLARGIWLMLSDRAIQGEYIDSMTDMALDEPNSPNRYGGGIRIYNDMHVKAIGHGGAMPGYRAYALYLPNCDLGLAVQTNDDSVDWGIMRKSLVKKTVTSAEKHLEIDCN